MEHTGQQLKLLPNWSDPSWHALTRKPLVTDSGRGSVYLVFHPKGTLVERQYRHGGLRRGLLPELFWKGQRAAHELAIHLEVFEKGIATTEPVGWREQLSWLPFCRRYFYYSVYLENAETLPRWLAAHHASNEMLRQMAHVLHQLFLADIFHGDLNLNNWLVHDHVPYLIDFDKARSIKKNAEEYLEDCLCRMVRSAKKLGLNGKKTLFYRFLLIASSLFEVDPRSLLASIPRRVLEKRFYHEWVWKISGGHRGNA